MNKIGLIIDRMLSNSRWNQLVILLAVFALVLVLSFGIIHICNWNHYDWDQSLGESLMLLSDPNYYHDVVKDGATYLGYSDGKTIIYSSFIYFLGLVVFGGMLISLISNVVSRRVYNHLNGRTFYLKSGHTVILGYDEIVPSIIINICSKDKNAYVLLMSSINTEIIREKILRSPAMKYENRIIINYGHRTDEEALKAAHIESSNSIFVVGNRSLPSHDAMNVECIQTIGRLFINLEQHNTKVYHFPSTIFCVFEDFDTFSAFQSTNIFDSILPREIQLIPYNFYQDWAKKIFVDPYYNQYNNYPALDGGGITYYDDSYVHIVIVGISTFGTSLAVEAAKTLHFPNFDRDNKLKTKISFIDKKADEEINLFRTRNHNFFEIQSSRLIDMTQIHPITTLIPPTVFKEKDQSDFLDIDIEFIKGDVYSDPIRKYLIECSQNKQEHLAIIIAMANQQSNFAIAMNMPNVIYEISVPIFIRQELSSVLVSKLHKESKNMGTISKHVIIDKKYVRVPVDGKYAHIYPFGMTDVDLDYDTTMITYAKLINYLYYTAFEEVPVTYKFKSIEELKAMNIKSIMYIANERWSKLSVAKQWSNLYCAYNIPYRLNSLKTMRNSDNIDEITDDEAKILGVVEHNRWNVEKLLLGFRKPLSYEDVLQNKDQFKGKGDYSEIAKDMKDKLLIHCDIRPFHGLDAIQELDLEIVRYIPWVVETASKMKKSYE